RQFAEQAEAEWDRLAAAHAGNPRGELTAWLVAVTDHILAAGGRGCALANAAVELAEKDHPARKGIEEGKRAQRERLGRAWRGAGTGWGGCAAPGCSTSGIFSPTSCSCCWKAPGSVPRVSAVTAPPPASCAWGRRSSPRTRRWNDVITN